jgi:hypothetical protein
MIKEFPYINEKGRFYPLVPVTIAGQIASLALVDSGAELSLFRQEVAEELNIEIEKIVCLEPRKC